MTRARLLPLAAFLALLLAALPAPASAQTPAFTTTVENAFPEFLHLRLTTSAPAEVVDVTLRYRVVGAGALARAKPETFELAAEVRVAVRIPTGRLGFIPVGSQILYHWELTLADGAVLEGPEERYTYLPPGQTWNSLDNDFMRVYYHGDREAAARRFLTAAEGVYQRIGRLLQTELEVVPVNTVLFASEADLEEAQPNRSEAYDAATFLCGTQVADNVIFVTDRTCGTRDRDDTLRHEFAHILTKAAGEGGLGQVPSWLDEGVAVYAQTEPGDGFIAPFDLAVLTDRLIPFRSMITGNTNPGRVGLYYGQSYAMVDFLIETGGAGEFARLFATIKAGARFDRAIETVYGWDLDEFENAFRAHHELPAREPAPAATPRDAAPSPTAEPTQAPAQPRSTPAPTPAPEQTAPEAEPAAPASDGGGRDVSNVAVGVLAGGALLALLAVGVFLIALRLNNRRPRPAADSDALPDPEPSRPDREPPPEFDEWGPRSS